MIKTTNKLEMLAEVQSGLVLQRKRASSKDENTVKYDILTLKSFDETGLLDLSQIDSFLSIEILEDKYLAKKGDIIMRLTEPYTAIHIDFDHKNLAVPSNFVIIRVKGKQVSSEYLCMLLNSNMINKVFYQNSVSVTTPLIKVSMLRELDITIKDIKTQQNLVQLEKLARQEHMLLAKLRNERKQLVQTIIEQNLEE